MGHITIDWWNDKTISYLMLEMHQRRWHGGEKKREFDGLVLSTVHAQHRSTKGAEHTPIIAVKVCTNPP